jgi:hypothetical protein
MNPKYWEIGNPIDQIIEECSELTHILCKARRFGWHNHHPDDPDKTKNYHLVVDELGDLKQRIREFEIWMQLHRPHNQATPPDAGTPASKPDNQAPRG